MNRLAILGPYRGNGSFSTWNYFTDLHNGLEKRSTGWEIDAVWPGKKTDDLDGLAYVDRRTRAWMETYVKWPLVLRRLDADVIHIVDQGLGWYSEFVPRKKVVITVHDLINYQICLGVLSFGQVSKRRAWLVVRSIERIKKAEMVCAISRYTADCLIRYASVSARKIHITPNHVNDAFRRLTDRDLLRKKWFGNAEHVVIHVGKASVYKNRIGALKVFARVRASCPDARMWAVHGAPTSEEKIFLEEVGLSDQVVFLEPISQNALVEFYNAADCLIFPSLYEGFGVPPLEAMACGCCVVGTNRASLSEVIGEGGLTVSDPADIDTMATYVVRVLKNKAVREDMMAAGLQHVKRYRPAATLNAVVNAYGAVIGGGAI